MLNLGKSVDGHPFGLPLTLVTSTQAILARKRSGKSYTASVEAEELLAKKQQIVVIDPTGAWWGLRSSANGESAGYPVVVFGGDHPDAPLDWRGGKAMAAAVVNEGFSAIFDVSSLETDEQIQFVTDFTREMLRINREAIHIFIDEADTYAPQLLEGKLQKTCLGAVSRLVKQGGKNGLGVTMITQRPADLNKKVLSQVDILTVLRMSHPLDIKAVTTWIATEVSADFAERVGPMLPSLPVGDAFVCAASLEIGAHIHVRERRTFNSGATPKPGERKVEPKVLAPIDIEKLGQKIAESVKRTREEAPEFLKERIATLEQEIAKGGKPSMELMERIKELEAKAARAEALEVELNTATNESISLRQRLSAVRTHLATAAAAYAKMAEMLVEDLGAPEISATPKMPPDAVSREFIVTPIGVTPTRSASAPAPVPANPGVVLRGKSATMLQVCASMYPKPVTEAQVATRAGIKKTSGTFSDYKSLLRTSGIIRIEGNLWYATEEGMRRAGTNIPPAPRTTAEVLELWWPKLRGKSKDMLEALVNHRGRFVEYSVLAQQVGMEVRSGTFSDYLSLLRTLDLIVTEGGRARANAEVLFL